MADGLLRSVYQGCIAGADAEIDRRPYHKNCGCALCDRRNRQALPFNNHKTTVSYPIRRAWSEGSFSVFNHSSPSSSPPPPGRLHLGFNNHHEDFNIVSV